MEVDSSAPSCLVNSLAHLSTPGRYAYVCSKPGGFHVNYAGIDMNTGTGTHYFTDKPFGQGDSYLMDSLMDSSNGDIIVGAYPVTRDFHDDMNYARFMFQANPGTDSLDTITNFYQMNKRATTAMVRCYHNAYICFMPNFKHRYTPLERITFDGTNDSFSSEHEINRLFDQVTIKQDTNFVYFAHSTDMAYLVIDHTALPMMQYATQRATTITGIGASCSTPVFFIGEAAQIVELDSTTFVDLNAYPVVHANPRFFR